MPKLPNKGLRSSLRSSHFQSTTCNHVALVALAKRRHERGVSEGKESVKSSTEESCSCSHKQT